MREGGGGEERGRKRVEEEDEVVGCCSGYVLRNHQLMQRRRRGCRSRPDRSSEVNLLGFISTTAFWQLHVNMTLIHSEEKKEKRRSDDVFAFRCTG